jgi:kynurenine formamidase
MEQQRAALDARVGAPARFDRDNVLRGLAAAVTGEIVSLNAELDDPHPPFGRTPFKRSVRLHNQFRPLPNGGFAVINDDDVSLALQGSSQWDSFAHFGYVPPGGDAKNVYHGGAGMVETFPAPSAGTLGIQALGPGIVCRGVLLDVVSIVGGDFLDGDVVIDRRLLEQTIERQDVQPIPGDALIVHTGFEKRRASLGGQYPAEIAGLVADAVGLIRELDPFALASDNAGVERNPADYSIHIGVLRDLGIPLGELWATEALAQRCRSLGRYDFCLASVPLAIHGAFGSTANAVAIL